MSKFVTKLLVAVFGLFLSLSAISAGSDNVSVVVEGSKAASMDACVRPTPEMRRNHFELIKHQRDITVHEGIRKTDDSLAGCVSCHAAKDSHGEFVAVDDDEQFCATCHAYTGVTFDCFSCHSAKPTKTGN